MPEPIRKGFVCPKWALACWLPEECTIEKCTDGRYAVVDHFIQTTIYIGTTAEECTDWLGADEPFFLSLTNGVSSTSLCIDDLVMDELIDRYSHLELERS